MKLASSVVSLSVLALSLAVGCGKPPETPPSPDANDAAVAEIAKDLAKGRETRPPELISMEKLLRTQNEALTKTLAEDKASENEAAALADLQKQMADYVRRTTPGSIPPPVAELQKNIDADLFVARSQNILHKLRTMNRELGQTVDLAFPPRVEPSVFDDLLEGNPDVRKARRKKAFIAHLETAEALYAEVLDLVAKQGLQNKLYVARNMKSFAQTPTDLGGQRDVNLKRLQRQGEKDQALAQIFFIKVVLDEQFSEDFLRSLGTPPFFRETNEYETYDERVKAWTGKVEKLRELLLIKKSPEEINGVADILN